MVMMSMKSQGVEEVKRGLELAKLTIDNVQKYFPEVAEQMDKDKDAFFKTEGKNFEREKARSPLSPSTQKARITRSGYYKKQPNNPGILRWTGNLQKSIKKVYSKSKLEYIFTADYAKYHHDGKGRKKRKVFELNRTNVERYLKIIQAGLSRDMGISSFR